MPRELFHFPIAALIACGCSRREQTVSPPTLPVIRIDSAHSALQQKDNALRYSIAPSVGFVLDAGGLEVPRSANADADPNVVQMIGKGGVFVVPWDPHAGKAVVAAETVQVIQGSGFSGFRAGESWVVAIGTQRANNAERKLEFFPAWVAIVEVAATR
jgi:hypothetical protein